MSPALPLWRLPLGLEEPLDELLEELLVELEFLPLSPLRLDALAEGIEAPGMLAVVPPGEGILAPVLLLLPLELLLDWLLDLLPEDPELLELLELLAEGVEGCDCDDWVLQPAIAAASKTRTIAWVVFIVILPACGRMLSGRVQSALLRENVALAQLRRNSRLTIFKAGPEFCRF